MRWGKRKMHKDKKCGEAHMQLRLTALYIVRVLIDYFFNLP